MLTRLKQLIKVRFPLTKTDSGLYPVVVTEEGDMRCPNCGDYVWRICEYSTIKCNTCYSKYQNLGIYGLSKLE